MLAKNMKEKEIQKQIMDYLELKGWVVVKINNVGIRKVDGSFIPPRQKGISDLICCNPKTGQFTAIEVKRPDGRLTDYQSLFLDQVKGANGKSLIAYSLEEVLSHGY